MVTRNPSVDGEDTDASYVYRALCLVYRLHGVPFHPMLLRNSAGTVVACILWTRHLVPRIITIVLERSVVLFSVVEQLGERVGASAKLEVYS